MLIRPAFSGCEGSSNKRPIQNLSVSPCLRSLRVWRRRPLPQGKILILIGTGWLHSWGTTRDALDLATKSDLHGGMPRSMVGA